MKCMGGGGGEGGSGDFIFSCDPLSWCPGIYNIQKNVALTHQIDREKNLRSVFRLVVS